VFLNRNLHQNYTFFWKKAEKSPQLWGLCLKSLLDSSVWNCASYPVRNFYCYNFLKFLGSSVKTFYCCRKRTKYYFSLRTKRFCWWWCKNIICPGAQDNLATPLLLPSNSHWPPKAGVCHKTSNF